MSKTTIFLLIVLLFFAGFLAYLVYAKPQNPVIKSFEKPLLNHVISPSVNTELSLSSVSQSVRPGETTRINVIIHNTDHPNLTQLEIAYDPATVTIDSIVPGNFFYKPEVALKNVDPVAGRLSYALRCQSSQQTTEKTKCINTSSNLVATITLTINPYTLQNATTLSFQPKTVVRTLDGRDLLKKTSNLQLPIARAYYQPASSSGVLKSILNQQIHVTPVQ